MPRDRITLTSIDTLTLLADQPTKSRRTAPVPQLECTGILCRDYAPSSVQCTNAGGTHIDIDWKCEADLPAALRFGHLHVSCEGWDRQGDPYVLKDSCGLQYSLVRTPQYTQTGTSSILSYGRTQPLEASSLLIIILVIFFFFFAFCYYPPYRRQALGAGERGESDYRGGGPTSSSGVPPPYTKHPDGSNAQNPSKPEWAPGFWAGLGAGGLAAASYYYLTRPRDPPQTTNERYTAWDWERPIFSGTRPAAQPESSAARRRPFDGDRAGSSTGSITQLDEMRRTTGLGAPSVR